MVHKVSYIAYGENEKATSISRQAALSWQGIIFGGIGSVIFIITAIYSGFDSTIELVAAGCFLLWFLFSIYTKLTADKRIEKAINPDDLSTDEILARVEENKAKAIQYLTMDINSKEFKEGAKANNATPEFFIKKCEVVAYNGMPNGSYSRLK